MADSNAQAASLLESLRGSTVVADTSSLLMAGTGLLTVLPECQLVVPAIVVTELEAKRTHATLGFLAREWLRLLEDLRVTHGKDLREGVPLEDHIGVSIKVEPNHSNQGSLPLHLQDKSNDSTILAVAKNLASESTDTVVILSNDIPMRLKATLDLNLDAYEFNATQLVGAKPFDGHYSVEMTEDEFINTDEGAQIFFDKLPEDVSKNAFVERTLVGSKTSEPFIMTSDGFEPVARKQRVQGIVPRTLEQDVAVSWLRKPADEVPIVSLSGGAGTGKTLLTLAVGIEGLCNKEYQKIIVFRSLHEMGAGQEMGFLPGGVNEKMEAWAGAVYDAIDVLAAATKGKSAKNKSELAKETMLKTQVANFRSMVEVSPITYLRGRSLANTYIVLEEAQNFSRSEILNILSRAGEGSKIVLTSDAAQVDNKYLKTGKDADIWSVVESLRHEDLFAHITLKKTERSRVAELASRILAS